MNCSNDGRESISKTAVASITGSLPSSCLHALSEDALRLPRLIDLFPEIFQPPYSGLNATSQEHFTAVRGSQTFPCPISTATSPLIPYLSLEGDYTSSRAPASLSPPLQLQFPVPLDSIGHNRSVKPHKGPFSWWKYPPGTPHTDLHPCYDRGVTPGAYLKDKTAVISDNTIDDDWGFKCDQGGRTGEARTDRKWRILPKKLTSLDNSLSTPESYSQDSQSLLTFEPHNTPPQCHFCHKVYKWQGNLRRHVKKMHSTERHFKRQAENCIEAMQSQQDLSHTSGSIRGYNNQGEKRPATEYPSRNNKRRALLESTSSLQNPASKSCETIVLQM